MTDSGLRHVGSDQLRSPVEVAQAYIQAWNAHDGEAVVRTFADDGTYVDPTLPEPLSGDGIKGLVDALVTGWPDLTFETEGIVADGDRVVLQWRMTGTNDGPLPGMSTPTGGRSNLPGIDVIAVGPDGITSVVGYFDQITLLAQLGLDVQVGPPDKTASP